MGHHTSIPLNLPAKQREMLRQEPMIDISTHRPRKESLIGIQALHPFQAGLSPAPLLIALTGFLIASYKLISRLPGFGLRMVGGRATNASLPTFRLSHSLIVPESGCQD